MTNEVEDLQAITTGLMASIIRDRNILSPSSTNRPAAEALVTLAMSLQPYLMTDETAVPSLWERVRADEAMTTLLLQLTFNYITALGGVEKSQVVARAYSSALSMTVSSESIMDDTMKERAIPTDKHGQIDKVLLDNMWFVVLMIIGNISMKDQKVWSIDQAPPPAPAGRTGNGSRSG